MTLEDAESIQELFASKYAVKSTEGGSDRHFAFIFDRSNRERVISILSDWLNLQLEVKSLDDVCDYFVSIDVKHETSNYLSYLILAYLSNANVPFIVVNDRCGELTFRIEINAETQPSYFYRQDLRIPLRSTWEANVARILGYLGYSFKYEAGSLYIETKMFKGYYFPDFMIDGHILIEVKGFWRSRDRQKTLGFSSQCKGYELFIIDSDYYVDLKRVYKQLIPMWEEDSINVSGSQVVEVVGIGYGTRSQTVKTLVVGQELVLCRDIGNKFDSNAILVFTKGHQEVGFISADWSCIYGPKIDIGMEFSTYIVSIEPKVLKLRILRTNQDEVIIYDFLRKDKRRDKPGDYNISWDPFGGSLKLMNRDTTEYTAVEENYGAESRTEAT
ncbi:MAG: HIRAN domain-containing protein [Christensenellaceae bacterium]|nr:HIRAN domain-containing protein [Christensenellaceae bacterium]